MVSLYKYVHLPTVTLSAASQNCWHCLTSFPRQWLCLTLSLDITQLEWISEDAIPCPWLFSTPPRDAAVDSHVSTTEQQQMDIKALLCSCSSPSDDQICWRVLLTGPNSHIRLQTKNHGDLDTTAQGCSQSTKGTICSSCSIQQCKLIQTTETQTTKSLWLPHTFSLSS